MNYQLGLFSVLESLSHIEINPVNSRCSYYYSVHSRTQIFNLNNKNLTQKSKYRFKFYLIWCWEWNSGVESEDNGGGFNVTSGVGFFANNNEQYPVVVSLDLDEKQSCGGDERE